MILPICRMGNPILRRVADTVGREFVLSGEFKILLKDMENSMRHYGGIGIAAPQLGISKQIALIELLGVNRYGQEINLPLSVFINPKIEFLDQEVQGFWEGCLSIPGLRGYVKRPRKIKVNYMDEIGQERELIAEGFLATVLQHELDHLQGILYVDRLETSKELSYQEEYDEFILNKEKSID